MPAFQISAHGLSDIGPSRTNNEDLWTPFLEYGFFTIADGMGGHNAGEIAAKEATSLLYKQITNLFTRFSKYNCKQITKHLYNSFLHANHHVYELGKKHLPFQGMGTTLCCLFFHKKTAILMHVGDSRIYRFRKGRLKLMTRDHSLENKLKQTKHSLNTPNLSPPPKNIITQVIGTTPMVSPDISFSRMIPGDIFLMCTDGFSDYVTFPKIIKNILSSTSALQEKSHLLIETAKKMGSCDNITCGLITIT